MDCILKSNEERIVLNDYIENDPLSEENLDKTLEFANKIRLLYPNKIIWLYSGFTWQSIMDKKHKYNNWNLVFEKEKKRKEILKQIDVLVDGQYIDSQKDITLAYRGSKNQRVIDVQKSLEQNKIVLWCS